MKPEAGRGGLVYSTDTGRMCPVCRHPVAQCVCGKPKRPAGDGIVRVSLDTKGRKGKGVTVVKGVLLGTEPLALLGRQLKAACGSGGTVKEGVIEVQGDHRDTVIALLEKQAYKVKRAGG